MKPTNGSTVTLADLRSDIIGIDQKVPLLDGSERPYVFLDNAASTPAFRSVLKSVEEFLPWYSSVHRGTGYKAVVATNIYDEAHDLAGAFVGADPTWNVVVFGKNTTECVNKLAYRCRLKPDDVVITTAMEHHSNDLPWRRYCKVVHTGIQPGGGVDLTELQDALRAHKGKVRLVAVSGASNVTGICSPIHDIAQWAHEAGAKIFVDVAQLAPHRPIDILPNDDPRHLDFIAFSAHKMYAPFGIGVLVGPAEFFEQGDPDMVGGGTISYVGLEEVEWGVAPQKEEAGSPNVVGAVALAQAITVLQSVGMDAIAQHEQELLGYAIPRMKKIPGMRIYGPTENFANKVGVIPFAMEGADHALVATILSAEGGIGVRNGNFCAQPYMRKLLGVTPEVERASRGKRCDTPTSPGMVRASLGCYNNIEDIDRLIETLERIARKEYRGTYTVDPITNMYRVKGLNMKAAQQLRFFNPLGTPTARDEVA